MSTLTRLEFRLSADAYADLKQRADALGVSPTVWAKSSVMSALARDASQDALLQRLQALSEQVVELSRLCAAAVMSGALLRDQSQSADKEAVEAVRLHIQRAFLGSGGVLRIRDETLV